VARVGEVGGVSLPGAAHAPCPRRRADRTASIPGAAAGANIHVGPKPPVRDTPPTSPTPPRTLSLLATRVAFPNHIVICSDASPARNLCTRQRKSRRRRRAPDRVNAIGRVHEELRIASMQLDASTKNSGWVHHKPTRRRRMVGPMFIRRLGSNMDVGPSSSYRDVRHTVHASAWTRAVRGAGGT
jgi:hypothetical protein